MTAGGLQGDCGVTAEWSASERGVDCKSARGLTAERLRGGLQVSARVSARGLQNDCRVTAEWTATVTVG